MTRAALILDVMAQAGGEAVGPSELARRLSLPKSSIANICGALADAGLVRRVGTGFALGRRLAELGGAYLATVDQVQEFYEASRQLEAGSEETVQFAVLDGLEMTYLARHDGRQPVRLTSGIGRRLPASCTATGKAALASLDDAELARRFAGVTSLPTLSARSHRTVEELMADLREVRRRGYAIDDEETMEGVVCYGVMVESRQPGEGPYAASITLVKVRATARAGVDAPGRPQPARPEARRSPAWRRRPDWRSRRPLKPVILGRRGGTPGGQPHQRTRAPWARTPSTPPRWGWPPRWLTRVPPYRIVQSTVHRSAY